MPALILTIKLSGTTGYKGNMYNKELLESARRRVRTVKIVDLDDNNAVKLLLKHYSNIDGINIVRFYLRHYIVDSNPSETGFHLGISVGTRKGNTIQYHDDTGALELVLPCRRYSKRKLNLAKAAAMAVILPHLENSTRDKI